VDSAVHFFDDLDVLRFGEGVLIVEAPVHLID
jgi:hypothetical protein